MMSFAVRRTVQPLISNSKVLRNLATAAQNVEKPKESSQNLSKSSKKLIAPVEYRHIYPEFVPNPDLTRRNLICERLERQDMLQRRRNIDIPEFYVGSILAVTSSDPHAQGKTSRFLGICIKRDGCGLRAHFILRNYIDHQGVEIFYNMYDPTIQKIELIKLEKRLDDQLLYLRDALPEYSTFDVNMEPEIVTEGQPVPVNDLKVKLKPRPWLERWERQNLKGIQDLNLPERFYKRAEELATPWDKYDLMKQYRSTIPEEEMNEIFSEIYSELQELDVQRKKLKRKRTFVKPTKLA